MKADTTCQSFEIFEGPGRRKNNPNYKPGAAPINESKEAQPEPVIEDEASIVSLSDSLPIFETETPEALTSEEAAEEPATKAKNSKK